MSYQTAYDIVDEFAIYTHHERRINQPNAGQEQLRNELRRSKAL